MNEIKIEIEDGDGTFSMKGSGAALKWRPVAEHDGIFNNGDRYLIATIGCPPGWEISAVEVRCKGDFIVLTIDTDPFIAPQWEHVKYYIPMSDIIGGLPPGAKGESDDNQSDS